MKFIFSTILLLLLFGEAQSQVSNPPIVSNEYKAWTTSSELNRWLLQLSDIYTVEMRMYQGNNEVKMPVVVIPSVQENPLTVMIIAEQHGDEPSGMEACNLLISELLNGELPAWTDSIEWVIIPMVNAEGHDNQIHNKSNGTDLNMDHLILSQPETRFLHYMYNRYMPEVFIDLHEYPLEPADENTGLQKRIQQQIGCVTNLNLIDTRLDELCHQFILPHVQKDLEKGKLTFSEFWDGPTADRKTMKNGTVDISDGRHGMGAMGRSLSFVVEGLRGNIRNENIFIRTQAQFKCLISLVEACHFKTNEIKKIVMQNRDNVSLQPLRNVSIRMEHCKSGSSNNDSFVLPFRNLQTGKDSLIDCSSMSFPDIRTTQSIDAPLGYWISKKDRRLVDWIQAHEAGIFPFTNNNGKELKSNENEFMLQCISALPEWNVQIVEDMQVPAWKPEWIEMKGATTRDYIFVSTQTLNGLRWIMALEPESMFALVRYPEFEYLHHQYPILRVISR